MGTSVVNKSVKEVEVYGNYVYICGNFTSVGGDSIKYLAQLNASTGIVTSWNPNPDGNVISLTIHNGKLIVCGAFSTISGQARNSIAVYDAATGNLLPASPQTGSQPVNAVYGDGNDVYFNMLIGQKFYIKKFDINTGVVSSWASDYVDQLTSLDCMKRVGNYLYIGGTFYLYINDPIYNLARLDITTGAFDVNYMNQKFALGGNIDWVNQIHYYNGRLFVSGSFKKFGTQSVSGFLELDNSGNATNFSIGSSNSQNLALFGQGNTLWVGGNSSSFGGSYRPQIAQIDLSTGLATCWERPLSDNWFITEDMVVRGDTVYAGALGSGTNYFHIYIGNPTPFTSGVSGPDTVYIGQTVSYYAPNHPSNTYQWTLPVSAFGSSSTNSISVLWNTAGTYNISLQERGPSNCSGNTVSKQVVVLNSQTSSADLKTQAISIHQVDNIHLLLSNLDVTNETSLQLYDLNGHLVLTEILSNLNSVISMEFLKSGIYIAYLKSNDFTQTKKVVKL